MESDRERERECFQRRMDRPTDRQGATFSWGISIHEGVPYISLEELVDRFGDYLFLVCPYLQHPA